jgi:hypothetical protein
MTTTATANKMTAAPTRVLTAAEILAAPDLETREVFIPEWNGAVFVRGMTGAERDAFEDENTTVKGKDIVYNMANVRARFISRVVVDAEGNRLFSKADIDALTQKSAAALNRIWNVARELSGMTEQDVEELASQAPAD